MNARNEQLPNEQSPAVVSVETMAAILEDIAARVRRGLCQGGKIEFHFADDFHGAGQDEFSTLGEYYIASGTRKIHDGMDTSGWIFLAR